MRIFEPLAKLFLHLPANLCIKLIPLIFCYGVEL